MVGVELGTSEEGLEGTKDGSSVGRSVGVELVLRFCDALGALEGAADTQIFGGKP